MKLCTPNQFKFKPLEIGENYTSLNWHNLSLSKQELFIKYFLIIQYLSDEAIEEANEDLGRIIEFYLPDLSRTSVTSLPTERTSIKGNILSPKIRPSLVLDDF